MKCELAQRWREEKDCSAVKVRGGTLRQAEVAQQLLQGRHIPKHEAAVET
jgi:hypothetical protein